MPININIGGNVETLIVNGNPVQKVLANGVEVWSATPPAPTYPPYLTFSSPNSFILSSSVTAVTWDGTLEYSTNKSTWTTWDGTEVNSAAESGTHYIYLRGTGNTVITGRAGNNWDPDGNDISCDGDIRTLLDYTNPENATMGEACFRELFYGALNLIKAPALPATTLSARCYQRMFYNSRVATIPKLPATILPDNCYRGMFQGDTAIQLSQTQTGEYQTPYRIPENNTGTTGANSLTDMFTVTGGTFVGTPTINATYYTSNAVIG